MSEVRGKTALEIETLISLTDVAGGRRCLGLGRSVGLLLELLLLLELDGEDKLLRRVPRLSRLRRDEVGD
jgi:hypothetical protein